VLLLLENLLAMKQPEQKFPHKAVMEKDSCLISLRFSSARVLFLPVITILSLPARLGTGIRNVEKAHHIQSHNGVMTVMAAAHATLFTRCRCCF
jgi:hypothetical protein